MATTRGGAYFTDLPSLARKTKKLRDSGKLLQCIDMCLLIGEALDDLITDVVREARGEGASWELIGQHLGATRQATWQRFGHVDDSVGKEKRMQSHQATPAGRQAHFRDLSLEILAERRGTSVDLQDLYDEVEMSAVRRWIDQRPCCHNKNQFEWQHDLRWSLLQLKAQGLVRQPGRGRYEIV